MVYSLLLWVMQDLGLIRGPAVVQKGTLNPKPSNPKTPRYKALDPWKDPLKEHELGTLKPQGTLNPPQTPEPLNTPSPVNPSNPKPPQP